MPELPEVETVVRELQYLQGATIASIKINDEKVWFESELPPEALKGQKIDKISRRGKYIVFTLTKMTLLQHLRMTGKMLRADSPHIPVQVLKEKQKQKQIRFRLLTSQGEVCFFDTRRFGTITAVKNADQYWQKKAIAPDSIGEPKAALATFLAAAENSQRPLKALLLDQSAIAGVGNIYADEALHQMGIHPLTPAAKLAKNSLSQLFSCIEKIFHRSIRSGGTTVNNYLSAEGNPGRFVEQLFVYGRGGEICRTCKKHKIEVIRVAGRSTHFCPSCQKRSARGGVQLVR